MTKSCISNNIIVLVTVCMYLYSREIENGMTLFVVHSVPLMWYIPFFVLRMLHDVCCALQHFVGSQEMGTVRKEEGGRYIEGERWRE